MIIEPEIWEEVVAQELETKFKNKHMLNHNWKMVGGFAIVFIIGGLQALHGIGGWGAWIDMIVPVLLTVEHALKGNS